MYGKHPITNFIVNNIKHICVNNLKDFNYDGKLYKNNRKTMYTIKFDIVIDLKKRNQNIKKLKLQIESTAELIKIFISKTNINNYLNVKYLSDSIAYHANGRGRHITIQIDKELFKKYDNQPFKLF